LGTGGLRVPGLVVERMLTCIVSDLFEESLKKDGSEAGSAAMEISFDEDQD
jgi:hypothetical protein